MKTILANLYNRCGIVIVQNAWSLYCYTLLLTSRALGQALMEIWLGFCAWILSVAFFVQYKLLVVILYCLFEDKNVLRKREKRATRSI